MKQWMKAGIGIAALVLAVAAGTGAYAMRGGTNGSPKSAVADDQNDAKRAAGGASTMAMCAEGVTDCTDMIVEGDDGGDVSYDACPPDMACIEPWLMNPRACADGLTIAECFPDGVPEGWDCAELESFPVQVVCKSVTDPCGMPLGPIDIEPAPEPAPDEPVTILPAPAPGDPTTPIEAPEDENAEPVPPSIDCAPVPRPCDDTDDPAVSGLRCLPPDCAVSSDGTVACVAPEPCVTTTDPMAGIAENECSPISSDCVQYEDGSVACPGSSGGGCVGGPAVDCGPIGEPVPCVGASAVDCGPIDLPLVDPVPCVGGPAIDCPAFGEPPADRDVAELER